MFIIDIFFKIVFFGKRSFTTLVQTSKGTKRGGGKWAFLLRLTCAMPSHPHRALSVGTHCRDKLFQRYFMHTHTFTLFILYFLHTNDKQLYAPFSPYSLLCLMICWRSFCSDTLLLYILFRYNCILALQHSLWDLSPLIRDWTWAMVVKVQSPNHWTTREFPMIVFCIKAFLRIISCCTESNPIYSYFT